MIKVENIDSWGLAHAIRGMRNPLNSWDKSDSGIFKEKVEYNDGSIKEEYSFNLGPSDLNLMKKLYKAGTEHRKYLRQICVSMDITAPLYWWKEFDTYKVGTVANSCSTMHKIASKEFIIDDFSHEHLNKPALEVFNSIIDCLNDYREKYLACKCKPDWWQMIQLLPSSYNQKRTVTMNYENVVTIINQRTGHKLDEWNQFVETLKNLPYIKDIMEI